MGVWHKVVGKKGAALREGPELTSAPVEPLVARGGRVCVEETVTNSGGTVRCRLSSPAVGWCSLKMLSAPAAPPAPALPSADDAAGIAALFDVVPPEERVASEAAVDAAVAEGFKKDYVQTYPACDVKWFAERVAQGAVGDDAFVLACVGDSITHGDAAVSPDWVRALRRRHPEAVVVNAGVGGDMAHNVLQRVDDVLRCGRKVDAFTLLVGTNDARFFCGTHETCSDKMTTRRLRAARIHFNFGERRSVLPEKRDIFFHRSYYAAQKKVPFGWRNSREFGGAALPFPSVGRYLADVEKVLDKMAAHNRAAPILLVSVPPLGDRVAFADGGDDDDAEAKHAVGVVREMNAGLRGLAASRKRVAYLPFFEAAEARLAGLPKPLTPYTAKDSNQLVTAATKGRAVHGRTFDAVGAALGLFHCCDMIHPTEQAIFPLLRLVEDALFPPPPG